MSNMRKYLTLKEIERLLEVVSHAPNAIRNCCLIYMCYIHGFRASELCRLTCQDIDMEEGIINVRRLKNGLSTVQPLETREKVILAQWLAERSTWPDKDSPWVFLSQKGGPLSRQQFYGLLQKYGKMAGISVHPHPHMLRHSCGFQLADLGTDTRLIQDYLGHRNIRHTVLYTASNSARFVGIWKKENEINEALWTKL